MRFIVSYIAIALVLTAPIGALATTPRHAQGGPATAPSILLQDPYARPKHYEDRKAREEEKLSMCNQAAGLETLRTEGQMTEGVPQMLPSPRECAALKRDIEARKAVGSSPVSEVSPEQAAAPVQ